MRCYLPILLSAFALGLVTAKCSDSTIPICCSSFNPHDSKATMDILGQGSKAPMGDFGNGCVHAIDDKCPPSKTLENCRYFTKLIGIAGGCVKVTLP